MLNLHHNFEQWTHSKKSVCSELGVVAAQNWMAAAVGGKILDDGGNAIDAAISCAFALSVLEPWMSGMGGSGFIVIWDAKKKQAKVIDFQGVLPRLIKSSDYILDSSEPDSIMGFPGVRDRVNIIGYKSITVPGAVAGLYAAQKAFGKMKFDTALLPVIELAERGLPIDWFTNLQISLEAADLSKFLSSKSTYLPSGFPPQPEQFLPLKNLSKTIRNLCELGPEDFYTGKTAEMIAMDLKSGGSRITLEDLASYSPIIRDPLSSSYRGAELCTAGLTSGGARLIEALEYIDNNLDVTKPFGPSTYSTYAKALNKAFRTHKGKMGKIDYSGCTSHISTVDSEGNMVALTLTLLNRFGSKVVLPSTGIIMNNAVSYFDPRQGFPTSMEAGKRINSSNMCPTICIKDNQALFSVGASGANQIVPCVVQLIAFMLDFNLSLEEAFDLPRIDADDGEKICVDPKVGVETLKRLESEFLLQIAQNLIFPKLYGCPIGVYRDLRSNQNIGCTDRSNPVAGAFAEGPFSVSGQVENRKNQVRA